MKRRTRVTKGRQIARRRTAGGKIAKLKAAADEVKGSHDLIAEIAELYRPIKKPVTLRLDADVLAWFQKARARLPDRDQSGVAKSDNGREERIRIPTFRKPRDARLDVDCGTS